MDKVLLKISESDCQKVLENYFKVKKHFQIKRFDIERISNSVGFLCEHRFLIVTIEDEQHATKDFSFFLKSINEENIEMTEFIKSGNMFNKEIACYNFFEKLRQEYPDIDMNFAPRYYYSIEDKVLVLENLTDTNYQLWDAVKLDVDHIRASLSALAKFHASSFIFEDIQSKRLNRKYSLNEDYSEYLEEALWKEDINSLGYKYIKSGVMALSALFEQIPTKVPHDELKRQLLELAQQAYKDIKPSTTFRNVLTHGDLWIKNVMFQYKDGVPITSKIFDFQFTRYAPPAQDVLHIIYDLCDREQYLNNLDYLLKHYYEDLKHELQRVGLRLEDIMSIEEFHRSVVKLFPTIKLIKSIHKSMTAPTISLISFDDPSLHVVQAFNTQEPYRKLMTQLLEDLEEEVINMKY